MIKLFTKKEEIKIYVRNCIRRCNRNSHIYKRDGYNFVDNRNIQDGGPRVYNPEYLYDEYFNRVDKKRVLMNVEPYTELEKTQAKEWLEHYWKFCIDKMDEAQKVFESKYRNIIDEAQKIAKEIPWEEEFYCGSAIVYFSHDSEIAKLLRELKGESKEKHRISRIFQASINVPCEGQSMRMHEKRARAMINYLNSKGLNAQVYSWAD